MANLLSFNILFLILHLFELALCALTSTSGVSDNRLRPLLPQLVEVSHDLNMKGTWMYGNGKHQRGFELIDVKTLETRLTSAEIQYMTQNLHDYQVGRLSPKIIDAYGYIEVNKVPATYGYVPIYVSSKMTSALCRMQIKDAFADKPVVIAPFFVQSIGHWVLVKFEKRVSNNMYTMTVYDMEKRELAEMPKSIITFIKAVAAMSEIKIMNEVAYSDVVGNQFRGSLSSVFICWCIEKIINARQVGGEFDSDDYRKHIYNELSQHSVIQWKKLEYEGSFFTKSYSK